MALEPSILHHCKPFFFLLLLLLLLLRISSSVATDTASSATTSFNFEISGEHSMEEPSSFSAAAAIPYLRVSASFSIAGAAPSAAAGAGSASDEMEKMLGDAAARLARSGRYIVAAAAIRAHLDELAPLRKTTILVPDDRSIADALYYESPPRFHLHVVPDRLLTHADLRRLPIGAELPTLDPGESLVLTSNGGGRGGSEIVQLNFVGVKAPDLVLDSRIAVHGVHLPISEFALWDHPPTSPPPSWASSPSSSPAPICSFVGSSGGARG